MKIHLQQMELSDLGQSDGRLGLQGGLDWGENRLEADIHMNLLLADNNSLRADFVQTVLNASLAGKPKINFQLNGALELKTSQPLLQFRELDQLRSIRADNFNLQAASLEASLNGELALPELKGQGNLQVRGDIHELLACINYALASQQAGKNLHLEIAADSDGQLLKLSTLDLALDNLSFKSQASFDRQQEQMEIKGILEAGQINLDNYRLISLHPSGAQGAASPEHSGEKRESMAAAARLLTKVKADITLQVEGITQLFSAALSGQIQAENGHWKLEPLSVIFESGDLDLNANADFNALPPALKLQAKGTDLNLAGMVPQLRQGRLHSLSADLTGALGDNLLGSLNGVCSFHLDYLAFSLPVLSELNLDLPSFLQLEQASADFKLSRGVANTSNLSCRGAGLQAAGSGSIDLPRKLLNLHVGLQLGTPKIPLLISGSLDDPQISVDKEELLRSAGQLLNEDVIRQGVESLLPRLGR
jgi:hypothetical protein